MTELASCSAVVTQSLESTGKKQSGSWVGLKVDCSECPLFFDRSRVAFKKENVLTERAVLSAQARIRIDTAHSQRSQAEGISIDLPPELRPQP